jgi:hypothetical protein
MHAHRQVFVHDGTEVELVIDGASMGGGDEEVKDELLRRTVLKLSPA